MNALSGLAAAALLAVSLFSIRPAGMVRVRLLMQAALLSLAMLARFPSASVLPGLALAAVEIAALWFMSDRREDAVRSGSVWWIVAGLAAVWLGYRLLSPDLFTGTGLSATPCAAGLGIVLCGALGSAAATTVRTRWAALLASEHGAILMAVSLPSGGWLPLLAIALLQGLALSRLRARPVWSDEIGADAG